MSLGKTNALVESKNNISSSRATTLFCHHRPRLREDKLRRENVSSRRHCRASESNNRCTLSFEESPPWLRGGVLQSRFYSDWILRSSRRMTEKNKCTPVPVITGEAGQRLFQATKNRCRSAKHCPLWNGRIIGRHREHPLGCVAIHFL